MPNQGVILAYPEDARVFILNRNKSTSNPLHKTEVIHNISALLWFRPHILEPGQGLDVRGRGRVTIKTGGSPPLVAEPGLLEKLVIQVWCPWASTIPKDPEQIGNPAW